MSAYVECPNGCRTFSAHVKAERWLASLGYVPEAKAKAEFPLLLARVFSDEGVSVWLKSEKSEGKRF